MAQITRTQFRNALLAILDAEKAASPALLRKTLRYRPGSMGSEKPVAWVGNVVEGLTYDIGTRGRTMTAEVVIADTFRSDNVTDNDPIDNLLDALVERFTAAYNVIPNTVMQLGAIEDGEVAFQGVERTDLYRGATLTVQLQVWEGRT